jgi:hypothetical protein
MQSHQLKDPVKYQHDVQIKHIEDELNNVRKNDLPKIYDWLQKVDTKSTIAICMFTIHLALVGIGIKAMYDNQKVLVELTVRMNEVQTNTR